jgi:hypothetical protein
MDKSSEDLGPYVVEDDGDNDGSHMGGGLSTFKTDKLSFGFSVVMIVVLVVLIILLLVYVDTTAGKIASLLLGLGVAAFVVYKDVVADKIGLVGLASAMSSTS